MWKRTSARALLYAAGRLGRLWGRARQRLWSELVALDPSAVLHASARLVPLGGDAGCIRVGAHTHLRGELLVAAHGGRIVIGDWCYVGEGTRLWSAAAITVGDRVLIAHGCEIHDWNAHSLDAERRHAHYRQIVEAGHPRQVDDIDAAPVVIEDDAWIGFGSTVLKGVRVGARSVVAARSLVVEDVPPDVLVGGAPARVLRALTASDVDRP